MHGNIWEWRRDNYDYSWNHDTEILTEIQGGSSRVRRGCSYYDSAKNSGSSYRFAFEPLNYDYAVGFRVALVRVQE